MPSTLDTLSRPTARFNRLAPIVIGVLSVLVLLGSANADASPVLLRFKELKKGSTFHYVDVAPAASLKHGAVSISPGDEFITTNPLSMEDLVVGKSRVVCTATTFGSTKRPNKAGFICSGIAKLPGGSLILAGEASEGVSEGAVTGGTGAYSGARGSFISRPERGGAMNEVTLIE